MVVRMRSHDIVTLDVRGPGRGALRCRDLESATRTDAGREAAACAALLGERRGLFRATDIAEDLELLRRELGAERITLVGVRLRKLRRAALLLRHPDRVERMVLEDVVDADGRDPLYLDSAAAARGCSRTPAAEAARPSRAIRPATPPARGAPRAGGPLRGALVGPDGRRRPAALTRQDLLYMLLVGDGDVIVALRVPRGRRLGAARRPGAAAPPEPARGGGLAERLHRACVSPAADAAATCEETRFPWAGTRRPPSVTRRRRTQSAHGPRASPRPSTPARSCAAT